MDIKYDPPWILKRVVYPEPQCFKTYLSRERFEKKTVFKIDLQESSRKVPVGKKKKNQTWRIENLRSVSGLVFHVDSEYPT